MLLTTYLALGNARGLLDLALSLSQMNVLFLTISKGTFKAMILWFDFLIQIEHSINVVIDFYPWSFFNGEIRVA